MSVCVWEERERECQLQWWGDIKCWGNCEGDNTTEVFCSAQQPSVTITLTKYYKSNTYYIMNLLLEKMGKTNEEFHPINFFSSSNIRKWKKYFHFRWYLVGWFFGTFLLFKYYHAAFIPFPEYLVIHISYILERNIVTKNPIVVQTIQTLTISSLLKKYTYKDYLRAIRKSIL